MSGRRRVCLRSPPPKARGTAGARRAGHRFQEETASLLVTLNVEEAADARREQIWNMLHEPYRTRLGYFRNEVGYHCWDRL